MFEAINNIYRQGDMQGIRRQLLHSSSWQQGQFSAYGESQHSRLWINWLTHCGISDITEVREVNNGQGRSALLLEMQPSKARLPVRAMFSIEHNTSHIKAVDVTVDTQLLQLGLDESQDDFNGWWPQPDPLIISDYDQQLHPETSHASPADLLTTSASSLVILEQWWEVWQMMQLSNIWQLYQADAEVKLPGCVEAKSAADVFEFASQLLNKLSRHYCQLEEVIQDAEHEESFAIKWYLEGDLHTSTGVTRVRLPFMSLVETSDTGIHSEYLVFDQAAFNKQFPSVELNLV